MRDVFDTIQQWHAEGKAIALATVTQTWGSAPRAVGAKMAISAEGQIVGSVSGGCVEGAVVEAALETLASGQPQRLQFGVADETAWEVGLACGGQIEVYVEALTPETIDKVAGWISAETGGALATIIAGDEAHLGQGLAVGLDGRAEGSISAELDSPILTLVASAIETRASRRAELPDAETVVFIDLLLPPPQLILIGGGHISVALAKLAKLVNFSVVVIDPRSAFANAERFPSADHLFDTWPQKAFDHITVTASTAVAVLTHDPKIDDPALEIVLKSSAFYIGALGSKRTQAKRRARFLEKGFDEAALDRIHGPIGLNIKARTPEEIGLAIMAEIIARYRGATR